MRITERDLELIRWIASMRLADLGQVARHLGIREGAALGCCRRLVAKGLLRQDHLFFGRPRILRATPTGCRLAMAQVPPGRERLNLNYARHDLELVSLSLWLLERHPGARWRSELELWEERAPLRGRGLSGDAPSREERRCPDGVLVLASGEQVAIELELTPKARSRYVPLVEWYARAREYQQVRYFVASALIAARLGELVRDMPFFSIERWPAADAGAAGAPQEATDDVDPGA